jgi:glucoamylase
MDAMASTSLSSFALYDPFNLTSIAAQFIMYPLSSLLLVGSLAVQAVLSLPDPSRVKERDAAILKRSVDSFLATESPIALAVSALASLLEPSPQVLVHWRMYSTQQFSQFL